MNLGDRYAELPGKTSDGRIRTLLRPLPCATTILSLTAMEMLPYPGAIAKPDPNGLRKHNARFTRPYDQLPPNIRVLEDDGSELSQIRILSGAKIMVLPILKSSLVASGISTGLNAMQLGKCVRLARKDLAHVG